MHRILAKDVLVAVPDSSVWGRFSPIGRVRRGFLSNVAVLMSGTAVAQALTLAVTPVLSRLYTPAAFGELGVFVSLTAMVSVIATLRYEMSIVLADSDDDAANLIGLSALVTVGVALGCVALVPTAGGWLARQTSMASLEGWLWWLPVTVLAAGWYQALNYWSTRRSRFNRLALSRICQSGTAAGAQTGGALLGATGGGLVAGQAIGQMMATCTLAYQVWRDDASRIRQALAWHRMRTLALHFSELPLYSSPQGLLNTISQSIPALILAGFFSPAVVGFYLFAERLLQVPMGLVGQSVRQVFFPRAVKGVAEGEDALVLLTRVTGGLAALALVPALVVVVAGPQVCALVLGPEWAEAGQYARWLAAWLFFNFINIPSVVMAQVYRQQRGLFLYDLALLLARGAALVVGGHSGSPLLAIGCFAAVGAVFNIGLIGWMAVCIRRRREQACPA